MQVTLEQALEMLESRIVHKDGNAYISVEDMKKLKDELKKLDEAEKKQEPEEPPKTMDQARVLAVSRIEEALATPSGNEAVKS